MLEAADEIGGGTRTSEAIVPGLLHDHCSAIHPMAVGSPFLACLGLERYGLTWCLPEIDCVHPLDDGRAGVLYRSVEATADGLGTDHWRWRRLFGLPDLQTVRRAIRRHHGTAVEGAAPPADSGAVRRADRAARIHYRQVVPYHRGAGIVRRGCGACLSAAALSDDLGDRAGHPHRGASSRVAGRGRRFAIDHQRDGSAVGRPGRQGRNGRAHRRGQPAAARRCDDVRPRA